MVVNTKQFTYYERIKFIIFKTNFMWLFIHNCVCLFNKSVMQGYMKPALSEVGILFLCENRYNKSGNLHKYHNILKYVNSVYGFT